MGKKTIKLIFWQNIISPHQISFFNELAKLSANHSITLVVERILTEDRIELGWEEPLLNDIELIINPDKIILNHLIKDFNNFHVFSGIRSYPLVRSALKLAKKNGSKFAILSEIPDLRGLKGFIRKLLSRYIERPISKKVKAVFAISKDAEDWYLQNGFSKDQIFPFIYTTLPHKFKDLKVTNSNVFKMVFVGRLTSRKGLSPFIAALENLILDNWQFDIIGIGTQLNKLQRTVSRNKLNEKIKFLGVMKNEEIKKSLSNYDLLILPSFHDGWGAVINESLMAGVPVLCSNKCGAKDLVSNSERGWVFNSGSKDSLLNLLQKILNNGPTSLQNRKSIIEWSQNISGKSVAKYFNETIDYIYGYSKSRPMPPWLKH